MTNMAEYSSLQLIKGTDKLLALSGIAHACAAHYLAGLWEADLVAQLCWRYEKPTDIPRCSASGIWRTAQFRGRHVVSSRADKVLSHKSTMF